MRTLHCEVRNICTLHKVQSIFRFSAVFLRELLLESDLVQIVGISSNREDGFRFKINAAHATVRFLQNKPSSTQDLTAWYLCHLSLLQALKYFAHQNPDSGVTGDGRAHLAKPPEEISRWERGGKYCDLLA